MAPDPDRTDDEGPAPGDRVLPTPWVHPVSGRSWQARLWKLCDALVTARVRPRQGTWRHGLAIVGRRTRNWDRPAAALNFMDSILPGTAAAWTKIALRKRKLPFRSAELDLVAFGTGDTVFRLGPPNEDYVLKVERISLGLRTSELVALAKWHRDAFDDVLRQYRRVADVFPPVAFIIVQSPLFRVPAVAALQPHVKGPLRDVVREVAPEELAGLAARRPGLRRRITGFLECTIASWERGGWIVDLGPQNLVMAGEGDAARLIYLDVEMKEAASIRGTMREAIYEDIVERMRRILEALGSGGSDAGERPSSAEALRPPRRA
jgi:hypothetical protein